MTETKRQLHLGAFVFGAGQHIAGWRHPETAAKDLLEIELYEQLARTAERGKLDLLLVLEQLAVNEDDGQIAGDKVFPTPDTLTLATIMANVTEHIGIGATHTTSYNEPYQVAHKFSTLSQITKGRIGWNMVTTQDNKVAFNFSRDQHFDHKERYLKAAEFVELVDQLWQNSGSEEINFEGNWYKVSGKIPTPSLSYGRPIRVQAGSSDSGIDFGSQYADAIFTAQTNIEDAKAFYQEVQKRSVEKFDRKPGEVKILPGLSPYIADTEEEAKQLETDLYNLLTNKNGLKSLSNLLDVDLSEYDLDDLVPIHKINPDGSNNRKARIKIIRDKAEAEKFTIRELIRWNAQGSGHFPFVGTPQQLADFIETWFESYACDGFVIMPPLYPKSLNDFVDKVVPILQEKGIFRKEYESSILLENLRA